MSPTWIPCRAAPTAIDAGLYTIGKRHEHQTGRVYRDLLRSKKIIHFGVDLHDFSAEVPAKEICQMHSVIHHRSAAGQCPVGKPAPVGLGDLAVVDTVYSKYASKPPLVDQRPHSSSGRGKTHRKRGHEAYTVLF